MWIYTARLCWRSFSRANCDTLSEVTSKLVERSSWVTSNTQAVNSRLLDLRKRRRERVTCCDRCAVFSQLMDSGWSQTTTTAATSETAGRSINWRSKTDGKPKESIARNRREKFTEKKTKGNPLRVRSPMNGSQRGMRQGGYRQCIARNCPEPCVHFV